MDLDDAYANGKYIPDAEAYSPRWEERAREWREIEHAIGRARLNLPYGQGERNRFDLFLPAGRPAGLVVFVHGGYWRAFDNKSWSHLAAGATSRGWAVAMPSYTLAPEARISRITLEIRDAIERAASMVEGPVVLTGHSAGGHLVARMLCPDVMLSTALAERLVRVVPISPLSDLRPLMETSMNEDLRLDEQEARAESPALEKSPRDVPVTVWVGEDERPAFIEQARLLADAWRARQVIRSGRHHFDVIDELESAESALIEALLSGTGVD